MTVEAECSDCGDVHPLGDRRARDGTTACPSCGSKSYSTRSTGERITKSERERIRDAIKDVDRVGSQTLAAISETYSTLAELEAADVDEPGGEDFALDVVVGPLVDDQPSLLVRVVPEQPAAVGLVVDREQRHDDLVAVAEDDGLRPNPGALALLGVERLALGDAQGTSGEFPDGGRLVLGHCSGLGANPRKLTAFPEVDEY